MKLILALICCFALSVGVAFAEKKEGKGKHAGGGGGGQGQRAHQGHGQNPAKRGGLNRQGGGNAAHLNGPHGNRAEHRAGGAAAVKEHGNGQAGQHVARAGGKAQVRHFDLANHRNTTIKSVTFKANRRIVGAERWRGDRYVVFRNYRSVWHDRGWWVGHYPRIVLIGGGYYYWNAGFWYPAWGYDPGAAYYPYDGPIYGYNDLPPDQVVANVQEQLQTQGYYHGEIDGMLGPLTRAALADYQRDHGLYTTSAIDEPTMASLGFGGDGGEEQAPEQEPG